MTKEELVERLIKIQPDGPSEDSHLEADGLLLEYINDPEITKAYNEIEKWHA